MITRNPVLKAILPTRPKRWKRTGIRQIAHDLMNSTLLKALVKPFVRQAIWSAKKKTISQILVARCRRDRLPEHGRFTPREIKRITRQARQNVRELMPYLHDLENIGNYQMEYGGLVDLATYRALVKEKIDPAYATTLVGDMIWQARTNARGVIPIVDPLRMMVARLTTSDRLDFLEKRLKDGVRYPYSQPGYRIDLYKDEEVWCMDIYSCPVYDFYNQFGHEELALFRRTWCTFDFAVAEHLVDGGSYQRKHTLSDGDGVCDMRWSIAR